MKKLSVLLLTLVVMIGLGACAPSQDNTELEELQQRVAYIEETLNNLGIIEGLNGQREYYAIPQDEVTVSSLFNQVQALDEVFIGAELDKSKAPSYVLDDNENYVNFDEVARRLVAKYYENTVVIRSSIGNITEIFVNVNDMTQEQFMARTVFLIQELSLYDFYIIGSSEIVIQTQFNSTAWISLPIQTLRSSFITMTPEVIINHMYEIELVNLSYDSATVQTLYNEFVTNDTFVGYVLNY